VLQQNVVEPGAKLKFSAIGERTFEAAFVDFPVFAARGTAPGPTLCVTAGIHGDELNSFEIARRVFADVDAAALRGTLAVFPALNSLGVRTRERYLADRRDLNRAFPGNPTGSVASILADAIFRAVTTYCDAVVDLHTGSNFRSNLPQIRADLSKPDVATLARAFGIGVIIDGAGPGGSLRRAVSDHGIPAIIYEAGPPYIFVEPEIARGVTGINNVMLHLQMIDGQRSADQVQVLERSYWVRVPRASGGLFFPARQLGDAVEAGDLLGRVVDPLTDQEYRIEASRPGQVIGMALPQIVLSGYGLFHIGVIGR
jgi:predicted deacylase